MVFCVRNVKNILLHELIGLHCEVIDSKNKSQIGINGEIDNETMKMISINNKNVYKKGSIFRINLDGKKLDIDGDYLVGRPEDRIKKKVKKW